MGHLKLVEIAVIRVVNLGAVNHLHGGNTHCHRVFLLTDGPQFHGHKLFVSGRSQINQVGDVAEHGDVEEANVRKIVHAIHAGAQHVDNGRIDRKSTRLNSSHANISYAVFCLKKKNNHHNHYNII